MFNGNLLRRDHRGVRHHVRRRVLRHRVRCVRDRRVLRRSRAPQSCRSRRFASPSPKRLRRSSGRTCCRPCEARSRSRPFRRLRESASLKPTIK
jgi:hypothetical protein